MNYIALSPIRYLDEKGNKRTIAPGRKVPPDLVDVDLLDCRAIEKINEAEDASAASMSDKPLNKQTKAELFATADAELVSVADGATNAEIIAAIEAKRAGGQG